MVQYKIQWDIVERMSCDVTVTLVRNHGFRMSAAEFIVSALEK